MTEAENQALTGKKKQKVLYLITKSNWGGAQKYVFDLATSLPKDKYEVKVALGGDGPLATRLREKGIHVIEVNGLERDISFKNDLLALIDTFEIIRKEKPDILHLNSTKISGLGSVIGRALGVKKIIFTAHGWAFNEDRSYASKSIIKFLYWITMLSAHKIIGVSENMINQIKDWSINKNKFSVIRNGIHSPNFLTKEEAREKISHTTPAIFEAISETSKKSANTIWIGSVGELHPIKGHVFALEAFAQILKNRPELNFIYVIIGDGDIRHFLNAEIKRLSLESHVFLVGSILDASNYLKAFDLYLFPSLSEGLSYAVIEAAFANLPIIASNVGGIPEIIETNLEGKLIPSQNPKAIEDAIYNYIDNPELANKYADAACARVSKEFSVENMVEKTLEVYK